MGFKYKRFRGSGIEGGAQEIKLSPTLEAEYYSSRSKNKSEAPLKKFEIRRANLRALMEQGKTDDECMALGYGKDIVLDIRADYVLAQRRKAP